MGQTKQKEERIFNQLFKDLNNFYMNSHNNYQQLAFNPKRQLRTDKHQRYAPQYKQNFNLPLNQNPIHHHKTQPYQESSRFKNKFTEKEYLEQNIKNESSFSGLSNYSYKQKAQSERKMEDDKKKEQIMSRVKRLQDMVLPMVERDYNDEQANGFGWQSSIQRKLIKIESNLDNVRKQWEIQMQKKLIQVQNEWQIKFQEVTSRYQ